MINRDLVLGQVEPELGDLGHLRFCSKLLCKLKVLLSLILAIDIWSVGVTFLCILTGQFPFFQSNNDDEALIEITSIFGKKAMENLALKLSINVVKLQIENSQLIFQNFHTQYPLERLSLKWHRI